MMNENERENEMKEKILTKSTPIVLMNTSEKESSAYLMSRQLKYMLV